MMLVTLTWLILLDVMLYKYGLLLIALCMKYVSVVI